MKGLLLTTWFSLSLLLLLCQFTSSFHQEKIFVDKRSGEEVLVYIDHLKPENRRLLNDFNINSVRSPSEVEAYIKDPAQLELLESRGFKYKVIPNLESRALKNYHLRNRIARRFSEEEEASSACSPIDPDVEFQDYHNYEQLTNYLKRINCLYPEITRLFSIGKSVAGRELWVLEITKNPGL